MLSFTDVLPAFVDEIPFSVSLRIGVMSRFYRTGCWGSAGVLLNVECWLSSIKKCSASFSAYMNFVL